MKEHRFKANGLTLNCLDYGGEGKRPLLFIHGGSAHAHWWDFVAPATDTLNPAPFMPPFYWLFHVRDRMLCEIELG